jgi:ParB/RepB/Spo0J family partition protein
MKTAIIEMVPIDKIVANPFRDLDTYPVVKEKVDSLIMSFKTVGMWESIIARRMADGSYQQAFGHQRLAAAKTLGLKTVPIIVKDLTDEQMVQYMGRENGEDYRADFLILLNTWEAGLKYASRTEKYGKSTKDVDIARLLGWTEAYSDGRTDQMNQVARACSGGHALIDAGHVNRQDFEGISVTAARQIVDRALSRMESINRSAKLSGAPAEDVKHAKSMVGKGVRATTSEVRGGNIPRSQVASRVDVNTMAAAGRSKVKRTPLFEVFGRALVDSVAKMLERDSVAERLAEIVKVIDQVVEEDDRVVLRQLDFQLGEVGTRAERWRKRLATNKVKPFPAPAQIGGPKNG